MIYKSIKTVSFAIYASLLTLTFGANYYVTSSSMNNPCIDATINDICHFSCNEGISGWKVFNCYNAGKCNIECGNENKCLEETTIIASNSIYGLNVTANGKGNQCLKSSTVFLPNHGNAFFSKSANLNEKAFEEITVHSGINTQNIYIDCEEKDDCNKITVNAVSSQYLSIDIGSGHLDNDGHPVLCPINTAYIGTSCIINASNDGNVHNLKVYSQHGMFKDVLISTGTGSVIQNLELYCVAGITSINERGEQTQNDCGNILATNTANEPTSDPTIAPTSSRTNDPTITPTISPTFMDANNINNGSSFNVFAFVVIITVILSCIGIIMITKYHFTMKGKKSRNSTNIGAYSNYNSTHNITHRSTMEIEMNTGPVFARIDTT